MMDEDKSDTHYNLRYAKRYSVNKTTQGNSDNESSNSDEMYNANIHSLYPNINIIQHSPKSNQSVDDTLTRSLPAGDGDNNQSMSKELETSPTSHHSHMQSLLPTDPATAHNLPPALLSPRSVINDIGRDNALPYQSPPNPSGNDAMALLMQAINGLSESLNQLNTKTDKLNTKTDELKISQNQLNNKTDTLNTSLNAKTDELKESQMELKGEILEKISTIKQEIDEIKLVNITYAKDISELKSGQNNIKIEVDLLATQNKTMQTQISQNHNTINSIESHLEQRIDSATQLLKQNATNIMTEKMNEITTVIEPKINEQVMETVQSCQKQMDEIRTKIDQRPSFPNYTGTLPIQVICAGNDTSQDRTFPRFNGRASNPSEYLTKLHRYYEKYLSRNQNADPDMTLIDLIENSLEGHASRWFQLIKNDITNWNTFKIEFNNKYWSREVQQAIKRRIEQENYRANGSLTRAEYFVEKAVALQMISPPLSEPEIVMMMAEKFEPTVKQACRVQSIDTIKELERYLHSEDLLEGRHFNRRNSEGNRRQDSQRNEQPHEPNVDARTHQNRQHNQNRNDFYNRSGNNNNWNSNQRRHNGNSRHYGDNQNNQQRNNENQPRNQSTSPQRPTDRNYPTPEQRRVCAIVRQQGELWRQHTASRQVDEDPPNTTETNTQAAEELNH